MNVRLLLALLLFCTYAQAQTDTVRQRIVLVGDGGDLFPNTPTGRHPVIDWLAKHMNFNDERNTVIFLGDNIYPLGLPTEGEPAYKYSKAVLDYQMSLVRGKKAKAYFIMGNHDWKNGKIGGLERALQQVDYINGQLQSNIAAYPQNGCPGPELIEIDTLVALALTDTQWFLHTHDKPGIGSGCAVASTEAFATELEEIAEGHPNQLLIVATHHPLFTYGVHGGATYNIRHHIFPLTEAIPNLYIPLPVLGSVYPVARGLFGNIQDVNHPLYRTMANTIVDAISKHPNRMIVSGHDHSLQLVQHDSLYQVVSGSAAELTRLSTKKNEDLLFGTAKNHGAAVIEVTMSGRVMVRFYDEKSPNYATPLYQKEIMTIKRTLPPATVDSLRPLPANFTVAANKELRGSPGSRLMLGNNYRQEWTTPLTVPVLDLGKEAGGMRPVRKGGGKQTKSLRLQDKSGKEWTLRSIEKFPEAAIPADLRSPLTRDIVFEGISASYPFAALSIAPMSEAAGLPVIRRKLVYVPDDPRLDRFRLDFSNTLAVLEEREPLGVKKTDGTDEVVLKLARDNDDHIDQRSVLKARLFDNFIMDFDRHEDQWRWAPRDTGKGKLYFAIPRDHDQAFFTNQGIIPSLVARPWISPELQGFQRGAKNIRTFNRPARNFDRFFLTELTEEDWKIYIDSFLLRMTDEVIDRSMALQPTEVQGFQRAKIGQILKDRRAHFREEMLEYYRFLSREVSITGSDKRELFTINKLPDGKVEISVNKLDSQRNVSTRFYHRIFDPAVTKELRIYGLGAQDSFYIAGGGSLIKLRVIGGGGNDLFHNEGTGGNVIVYDAVYEQNSLTGNTDGIHNKIDTDPQANRFSRLSYKYNIFQPGVSLAYNVDDGLYLGAAFTYTKQGFRKEPYASRQFFRGQRAFNTGALRFNYQGEWIKAVGNHALVANANVQGPVNVTNFFGLGNETRFDRTKPGGERFYRVRYDMVDGSLGLRRQLQSWMRVHYGFSYQYFRTDDDGKNDNHFITSAGSGIDQNTLFKTHNYLGPFLRLDIDSRNNKVIPTRGFVMDANLRPLFGLTANSDNLVRANLDMRIYASLFSLPRLVLVNRFGGSRIWGDFEYQQAAYLSGVDNLRGFRRDRFAGRSSLYNQTELRFKVADFNTYFFPGSFGLLAFNDVGRVWQRGENSSDWHVGNGVGVWVAPIRRFVLAAQFTRSKEEKFPLLNLSFGFQF